MVGCPLGVNEFDLLVLGGSDYAVPRKCRFLATSEEVRGEQWPGCLAAVFMRHRRVLSVAYPHAVEGGGREG
jgi:hypothetical protein